MNSGKSAILLQSAFNYEERNMKVLTFIPKIINCDEIVSRIGLRSKATVFDEEFNFIQCLRSTEGISCVLVDEAQFLTKNHVLQLCQVCDELSIPVLCYGLRSDFLGEPFEGSKYLLVLADKLIEIKNVCFCGKKATMNMRKTTDAEGHASPVTEGNQIDIGGNDKYISLCRKCYFDTIGKKNNI
jgi:thymidine kinase